MPDEPSTPEAPDLQQANAALRQVIVQQGASGDGQRAPNPLSVDQVGGEDPSITYHFDLGSDLKVYGSGDKLPDGPSSPMTITIRIMKGVIVVHSQIYHHDHYERDPATGRIIEYRRSDRGSSLVDNYELTTDQGRGFRSELLNEHRFNQFVPQPGDYVGAIRANIVNLQDKRLLFRVLPPPDPPARSVGGGVLPRAAVIIVFGGMVLGVSLAYGMRPSGEAEPPTNAVQAAGVALTPGGATQPTFVSGQITAGAPDCPGSVFVALDAPFQADITPPTMHLEIQGSAPLDGSTDGSTFDVSNSQFAMTGTFNPVTTPLVLTFRLNCDAQTSGSMTNVTPPFVPLAASGAVLPLAFPLAQTISPLPDLGGATSGDTSINPWLFIGLGLMGAGALTFAAAGGEPPGEESTEREPIG